MLFGVAHEHHAAAGFLSDFEQFMTLFESIPGYALNRGIVKKMEQTALFRYLCSYEKKDRLFVHRRLSIA